MMPRLDGFGLLRQLRNDPNNATIPVILLSARAGEESRVEGAESGADDYLVKPFSARELLARVTAQVQMDRLRREAEEAVRQSEERFRLFVNNSPTTAYIKDAEGRYLYVNQTVERQFARPQAEWVGKTDYNLFPSDEARLVRQNDLRVLTSGITAEFEEVSTRPDGKRHYLSFKFPLQDEEGRLLLAGMSLDITEQKQAEEVHRRLAAIVESSHDAIFSIDLNGTITSWNRGAERLYGYKATEIVGKPVSIIIPPDHTDDFPAIMEQLRRGDRVEHFETVRVAKGGRRVDVSLTVSPVLNAQGNIIGASKIARDITDRKRAEDERERFFAVGADVLAIAGSNGYFKQVSPACERTLGWSPDELTARPWADFLHPDDRAASIALEEQVKQGEEVLSFENRYRHKDGWYRWLTWRAKPFPAEGLIYAGATDITERKLAEEALKTSEQRFRQLADAMAQIVWTAQPAGQVDYLNRRWTEFTGLPPNIGNEGWSRILHPDDAPYARERWAASLQSGEPFEMEVRLLDTREQSYRWHLIRTVAVKDDVGVVIRWFGTSTDINGQKRAEESSRFLAEASAALAGVVDYESTLQKVANSAVPYFADWSAVDMADGEGMLRRLAVAHKERAKIDLVHELMREYPPDPQSPIGAYAAYRAGKPEFIAEITDDMLAANARDDKHLRLIRSLGLKSYICVPLVVSGKVLGVLTFATAESGRRYNKGDLALATDLAQRAAVAIENTQLYQALRDSDRRKDEFLATLAHELRNRWPRSATDCKYCGLPGQMRRWPTKPAR